MNSNTSSAKSESGKDNAQETLPIQPYYQAAPTEHPVMDRLNLFGSHPRREGLTFFCDCPKCLREGVVTPARFDCNPNPSVVGQFTCATCRCSTEEFLFILGLNEITGAQCPRLLMADNVLPHTIFDALTRALVHSGQIFQSFSRIMFVRPDKNAVRRVRPGDLISLVSRHLIFYKLEAGNHERRCKTPLQLIQKYLSQDPDESIPTITALVKHPVLTADGHLSCLRGFDPLTHLYHLYDAKKYEKETWSTLTKDDALKSAQILEGLLEEFPAERDVDKSAMMAAVLSAVMRPTLESCPLVTVDGNGPGTGKTSFCQMLSILATGATQSVSTFPKDESESTRTIFARLLDASGVVLFDNASQPLRDYDSLCACLTSAEFSARTVRSAHTGTASTNAIFMINGNNLSVEGDLRRRVLFIHMEGDENTICRTFKRPDLKRAVKRNLVKYQIAALKLIAAYLQSDAPRPCARNLVGFEHWSRYCREPLLWLGYADPLSRTFQLCRFVVDMGTGRSPAEELVDLLFPIFEKKGFFATDVIDYIDNHREDDVCKQMRWHLGRMDCIIDGVINARSLGNRLTKYCDRSSAGHVLKRRTKLGRSFYMFIDDEGMP